MFAVHFSPDGEAIVSGGRDGECKVISFPRKPYICLPMTREL